MQIRKKRKHFTEIPKSVKLKVWERDNQQCILCGGMRIEYTEPIINGVRKLPIAIYNPMPNAHYISRAKGGLGIEENIVTLCLLCHRDYDHTIKRREKANEIEKYLKTKYADWQDVNLVYRKR